jgi:hypothetical protein
MTVFATRMCFWLVLLLLANCNTDGFFVERGAAPHSRQSRIHVPRWESVSYMRDTFGKSSRQLKVNRLMSVPATTSFNDTTDLKHTDSKGKEFKEGCVVLVASGTLKAFQVQSKGYGTFDQESKEFRPASALDDGKIPRRDKCLVLPVGLRGVIQRVYGVDLEANQPLLVKFTPGEYTDEEGFDTPVPFLMHFQTSELEVAE